MEHMYELLEAEKKSRMFFLMGNLSMDFNFDKKANQTVRVKGDFSLAELLRPNNHSHKI